MRVTPERMVHGGRALARADDGRVVLVDRVLPGETVDVEVEVRSGVAHGTPVEVLTPSPDRVAPTDHPGLDYDFIAYDRQLALKGEVLEDAARRAGVALPEGTAAVRASPRTWAYRSAIQPAVVRGRLGYRRSGSDEVIVLDGDPSANPSLGHAWDLLGAAGLPRGIVEVALRGNDDGEVLAAFVTDVPERDLLDVAHGLVRDGLAGVAVAPWDARGRFRSGKARLAGRREILQRYGDVVVSVSATAFAQPNPDAAGELYRSLREMVPGGGTAAELFAGGGAIGMHLAPRYERVVAVEIAHESVTRGRRDAERLGIGNLEFVRADARKHDVPDVDLLAVDPPRAGLAKPLRAALDASSARHLAYVSCDVATWARDAADLIGRGWRLARVEPFDFAPHTHHLELLTLFER